LQEGRHPRRLESRSFRWFWLAEEAVTSELLSRLEQGKIQGKLGAVGDFLGHVRPKPIHRSGVVRKIQN
jgi:hypothetical protein